MFLAADRQADSVRKSGGEVVTRSASYHERPTELLIEVLRPRESMIMEMPTELRHLASPPLTAGDS